MDALTAIYTRRSVRHFIDQPITEEELTSVLKAGMCAPSGMGRRPFHFIVIRDRNTLQSIMSMHKYAGMLAEADLCIAVCGCHSVNGEDAPHWPQDCAAALENMLIAANALDLGAVWLGVAPDQERTTNFGALLALPENASVFGLMALGHCSRKPTPRKYYEPERIHQEKW